MTRRQPVAVVTGGGGGIGAAIAEELGRTGSFVVTVDPMVSVDGSEQLPAPAETTAGRIVAGGGSARASGASVTDVGALEDLFQELTEEHGVAVLLSAHEMNTLIPVMDRIVYLAGGRAASGSVEEVVRPEVLSALYGHPVEVLHVNDRLIVIAGPGHEHEFSASIPVDPALEQG